MIWYVYTLIGLLVVTNGLFVYQLIKLVQLDASVTSEEKEELETRKSACSIYWV